MPSSVAARRASIESSIVQQPRDPVRSVPGLRFSARCTPTTSCPASTARAAATALSTPPLIAARTFTVSGYARHAGTMIELLNINDFIRATPVNRTAKYEGEPYGSNTSFFLVDTEPGQGPGLHLHPYPE